MRQGDLGSFDRRFAEAAHLEARLKARVGTAPGPAQELQAELGAEGERGAVGSLEGAGDRDRVVIDRRGEVKARAQDRGGGRGAGAGGRVEGEFGPGDVGADVAGVDRDPLDDVGIASDEVESMKTSAV